MNRHPARQLAQIVMDAAGELRGYMNPDDPFPWELTDHDHLDLLLHLRKAVWDITGCLDGISRAASDEQAKEKLAGSIENLRAGCDGIELAESDLMAPGHTPGATTQAAAPGPAPGSSPAALAALGFPAPAAEITTVAPPAAPRPAASSTVRRATGAKR